MSSWTQATPGLVLLAGSRAGKLNQTTRMKVPITAVVWPGTGEFRPRLLDKWFNDPEARAGSAERGVTVPDDTAFLWQACTDTTTIGARITLTGPCPSIGQ